MSENLHANILSTYVMYDVCVCECVCACVYYVDMLLQYVRHFVSVCVGMRMCVCVCVCYC